MEQHHFAVEFAAVPRAFPTQFITAPLCGFQGLAVYVVAFARIFENAGVAGIQRLGRRQIERDRAIRHGAPFPSDGVRRAHPRQVLVFLPISVAHAAEQVQPVGDVEAGGDGGGLRGNGGLADFFNRAVVPVGGARQFAAVPRENVVCAVQPAAAPQIVEAFAAVVQSHIKLVFAPEQRIFAFQISFERPLVVVAVAAPQPAVRHGARCGNVAAERYIAVFGMRFILRINSGGGQLPIVVETMFQLGKCAELPIQRFVPVRAQIAVARQAQIRTVRGGR